MSNSSKITISTAPKHLGIGDVLWFLPSIKKLSVDLNKKIDIVTQYPQLFERNPYVDNIFNFDDYDFSSKINDHFFFEPLVKNELFYFLVNNKQYIANKLRFSLSQEEEEIEFFPNSNPFESLPKNYVMIHCGIRGPDRDLGQENWQKLIDILNEKNIPVIVEGPEQSTHDLNIKNGLNLRGKLKSISETWHLINQSACFVTFDTGMYILAGTTQTQIFLIDSYFDSKWHKPYRKGSYDYKHTIIKGNCSEYCLGNLRYYVHPDITGFWQRKVQQCPLNIDFKCKPSPEKISEEIISFWQKL